jgi:hypothetical protein
MCLFQYLVQTTRTIDGIKRTEECKRFIIISFSSVAGVVNQAEVPVGSTVSPTSAYNVSLTMSVGTMLSNIQFFAKQIYRLSHVSIRGMIDDMFKQYLGQNGIVFTNIQLGAVSHKNMTIHFDFALRFYVLFLLF